MLKIEWDSLPEDEFNEAAADAYCAGHLARSRGEPRPTDPHGAEGWDDAKHGECIRVVMPARPEGYYHMPIGSFDQ